MSGTRKVVVKVPSQATGVLGVVTPVIVTMATAEPPWQLNPVPLTVTDSPGFPFAGLSVIAGVDAATWGLALTLASLRPGRTSATGIMRTTRADHQRFIHSPSNAAAMRTSHSRLAH